MSEIYLHSMIKKYLSKEVLLEIHKIAMNHDADVNSKVGADMLILKAFDVPFRQLGPGTNRFAVLIEDIVFKFALDEDGMIDNRREFMYSKQTQPYTFKVYECMANGLVLTGEYCQVFEREDFEKGANQTEMLRILKKLSDRYLIGDVGLDSQNYSNWGYRISDGSIVILDFAYVYDLTYRVFECTCPRHGMLIYDNTYRHLICQACGKTHTFGDVRRRISRKQQEDEIGDIRTKGYVVTQEHSKVELNPAFSYVAKSKKKKTEEQKKVNKFYLEEMYEKGIVPSDVDEIVEMILESEGEKGNGQKEGEV